MPQDPQNLKVLLIGGGGREHAIAWKLAESPLVSHVFCAPGNAGTAHEPFVTNLDTVAEERPFDPKNPQDVLLLARRLKADLVVVGPEDPLAAGVTDVLTEAGLRVFGPTRSAARLESSKSFAKAFMSRHRIPTARFEVAETPQSAISAVNRFGTPVVVKADGLAAGKGVTVAPDRSAAELSIHEAMEESAFGEAGRRVVIEEYLEGQEVSVLGITDGDTVLPFPPAQDHKRVFSGDSGPNTGGMGAYCPAPLLGPAGQDFVRSHVLEPTIRAMAAEGAPFKGVLYAGLMLTRDGPRVLEFNCRFGDPETQVILPLLNDDLAELMMAVAAGSGLRRRARARDRDRGLDLSPRSAVCVVMASGGYPGRYETGKVIDGLEVASVRSGVKIFHAGTKVTGRGRVVTSGGRVLNVVATAPTLAAAVKEAYKAVALIRFEGAHFRTDIAARALSGSGG